MATDTLPQAPPAKAALDASTYHRSFGLVALIGVCCTTLIPWEALLFIVQGSLVQLGPVGLIWGYVFAWAGSLTLAVSLGELASLAPKSAGQYYWVTCLAPPRQRRLLTWLCGLLTVIGWQAAFLSGVQIIGGAIQSLLILNYPASYAPQMWHVTLLMWAAAMVSLAVDTVAARHLHRLEMIALALHFAIFAAVLGILCNTAPASRTRFVFTDTTMSSGWTNAGVAWLIAAVNNVYTLLGVDAAAHFSEETRSPRTTVPRAMLLGTLLNGAMGLAMALALAYNIDDLPELLRITSTPYFPIATASTGSVARATALTAFVLVINFCSVMASLAGAARVTRAFANDGGLPLGPVLAKLQQPQAYPLNALLLSATITCLLALINIGSSVALCVFISLSVSGIQVSAMIPLGLFIYRKMRGTVSSALGYIGLFVNMLAFGFLLVTTLFSFFPTILPVTAVNMNWSSLVFAVVVLSALGWYGMHAGGTFQGPAVDDADYQSLCRHLMAPLDEAG